MFHSFNIPRLYSAATAHPDTILDLGFKMMHEARRPILLTVLIYFDGGVDLSYEDPRTRVANGSAHHT